MAKKVIIVDDIDGTEGDGIVTQRFSLGSDFYEIDLCPQNLLGLRAALEPFVSAGRQLRGGNRRKPEAAPGQQDNSALDFPRQQRLAAAPRQQGNSALDFPRQQRLAIRNWARDNGYDVADRGAFSQEVLAAYQEASEEHKEAQGPPDPGTCRRQLRRRLGDRQRHQRRLVGPWPSRTARRPGIPRW